MTATTASTIVAVRARALDVPMKRPFGIAGGVQVRAENVVAEIELAGGVVGYGEAAPFPAFNGETQAAALAACERARASLVGRDVESDALEVDVASARCALETAIVDARARLAGASLVAVFGGAEQELVTDVTITTGTVPDATRDATMLAAFSTLKIKVGAADVDLDVARVLAVHRARPEARILVDANGGFSVDEAVRFAAELRRHDVHPAIFEQPVAPDWDALAEVRAKTRLSVAIDESLTRRQDVIAAKARGAADAVNVKIMKSGIFEALAIAAEAEKQGLGRMIGGMVETRLAMGVSACIAAGLGRFAIVDLDTPLFLAEDPWKGGYAQDGERIDLRPVTLGHGMTPR